jgi:hypothetical protein
LQVRHLTTRRFELRAEVGGRGRGGLELSGQGLGALRDRGPLGLDRGEPRTVSFED